MAREPRVLRVFVTAQSTAERERIVSLIAAEPSFVLVGTAFDAATARRLAADLLPDVLVYALVEGEPVDAAATALAPAPTSALLLLGDPPDGGARGDGLAGRASPRGNLGSGGRALLPRTAGAREFAAALRAAAAGLVVVHPTFLPPPPAIGPKTGAAAADSSRGWHAPRAGSLTEREREVLLMMAEGLPNKTIAAELGITPHTVKFHIASIMQKLDASSRTEAVSLGLRRGIIPL